MPSSPFPDRVLAWFERHGRKDLPWQNPRDAYRVWVSEIMLQQTQVSTVIPYFERWMRRFPDIETLAAAPEDAVLSLWSGLGYYARARNMYKTAQLCTERFGGRLPDNAEELTELPGIGRSTANAILSQAFDHPAAVLDGNVKRLLARHAGIEGWPGEARVQSKLWLEAEARLPGRGAADYSQAMMDLGALVCTRSKPACRRCPVSDDCRALEFNAIDRIPAPRPRKPVPEKTVHMLVLRDGEGRTLLQRRPPSGIWGGLWSLPEGDSKQAAFSKLGLTSEDLDGRERGLPDIEHRLTHLRLHIKPALVTLPPAGTLQCGSVKENPDMAWFGREALRGLGLPKPVNDLLQNYLGSE